MLDVDWDRMRCSVEMVMCCYVVGICVAADVTRQVSLLSSHSWLRYQKH